MTTIAQLIAANPAATDADIVPLYREANKRARSSDPVDYVTYTTLANAWGEDAASALNLTLAGLAGQGNAKALLANTILSGKGFDAQNEKTIATLASWVGLGVITQDQSDLVRWTYATITEADVATERARLTAVAPIEALQAQMVTFLNETFYPAIASLTQAANAGQSVTVPTLSVSLA